MHRSARWNACLQRTQSAWCSGDSVHSVLSALGRTSLASGELGYRLRLLESTLRWVQGDRPAAWRLSRKAHLGRLPLPLRGILRAYLAWAERHPTPTALRWGNHLQRLVPDLPELPRLLAEVAITTRGESAWSWSLRATMIPLAQDDALLLEHLMGLALDRIQGTDDDPGHLGHQEWSPLVPFVFEASLRLLRQRHGDPRIPWDRTAPAQYLFQKGRLLDAIALARSTPQGGRSAPLCEVEAMALHRLGDFQGAWNALETALEDHPKSFRLWMERLQGALNRRDYNAARESLEKAKGLIPMETDSPLAIEWRLHRAAFAQRIDHDPELAWELLNGLPETQRERHAYLLAQVLLAREDYEGAHSRLQALVQRHPEDLELNLLLAECLGGMGAWPTLLPLLEALPVEAQEQATYWHLKGLAWAHLDDPHRARRALETAHHLAPRDLRILLDAGHASAELGDHEQAERHWRQALSLDEASEEALYQMACSRHAQHDADGARRFLRECLLQNPENPSAQAFLAELESH